MPEEWNKGKSVIRTQTSARVRAKAKGAVEGGGEVAMKSCSLLAIHMVSPVCSETQSWPDYEHIVFHHHRGLLAKDPKSVTLGLENRI